MRMLGVNLAQLELLDLADILPRDESNAAVWAYIEQGGEAREPGSFEGVLRRAGSPAGEPGADSEMECVLALNPISSGGLSGFILLARQIVAQSGEEGGGDALARLAQEAPAGLFRARAARRGVLTELNAAARDLLERAGIARAEQPALADLFPQPDEYDEFIERLHAHGSVEGYRLRLQTVTADTITLSLNARLVRDDRAQPAWVEGMLQDITAPQKEAGARDALVEKLQASLLFLHEPVGSLKRQRIACRLDTPAHKAAALITAHDASAVLVESEQGTVVGMLTDHDLRARVLAAGLDPRTPVHKIMSAPLVTIGEDALIYEALLRMEEQGVQYLAVEDQNGQVTGVIRSKELVQFHRYGSVLLTREISRAASPEEVARRGERAPALVRALVDSGARPRSITQMLSTLCDASTERLIELAEAEIGPPPVEYAWIALGSQGRQEQTLLTDQDNAILYADPGDPGGQAAASEYFARLGARVCEGLAQAGYAPCRGQFMASNPRWRADLGGWQNHFRGWILNAEPQELLEFSIFFDFRAVHGSAELAQRLRAYIHTLLEERPAFFPYLAQNALLFKPPTRLPGRIYRGGAVDHAGQINLKDAMMPVVNFARLYALQNHVPQTHTLGRLDELVEKNALSAASRDEIASGYEFLMKLRLQRQLNAAQAGLPPDNLLQTAKIGHLEDALLQEAFAQISAVQKKITYDFLGGRE
jgi:CBS domain-containing protein